MRDPACAGKMNRLKIGDYVEVVGEMAAFCNAKIGVIDAIPVRAISVIKEFTVKLADGTLRNFFDFQLRTPPAAPAYLVYDSAWSSTPDGIRGAVQSRHLRFVDQELAADIHIKSAVCGELQTIIGQLFMIRKAPQHAMATLISEGKTKEMIILDRAGEFRFDEVPLGSVCIEFLVPSRRISTAFEMSVWKSTA